MPVIDTATLAANEDTTPDDDDFVIGIDGTTNQLKAIRVSNLSTQLGSGNTSHNFVGYTSSVTTPSTTELPADKDFCLHEDTVADKVYLAYNQGGVIHSVELT